MTLRRLCPIALSLLALGVLAAAVRGASEDPLTVTVVSRPGVPAVPVSGLGFRSDAAADDDLSTEEMLSGLPYAPGRLIVKVAGGLAQRLAAGIPDGATAASGDLELDTLNRSYGTRKMREFLAGRAARAPRPLGRFPRRALRALEGEVAPALQGIYVIELSPFLDMEQAVREYARVPGVVYAEPDRKAEAVVAPNDPYMETYGAWGQPFRDLWGLAAIDAAGARSVIRRSGMVIAVTDTGIDYTHPDIAAMC